MVITFSGIGYGSRHRKKDTDFMIVYFCVVNAILAAAVGAGLVLGYKESKKGAEAFAKESTARVVKVDSFRGIHNRHDTVSFDTDGNPETFEYYGKGYKAENTKEGQVMSGAEFIKENPKLNFYKSESR
ncbi:MAG: hypothetical protein II942_02835 [Alphaproteobacteria bacterium]|nr:hypothetical protein [Alphaproteobacteria bacterium]